MHNDASLTTVRWGVVRWAFAVALLIAGTLASPALNVAAEAAPFCAPGLAPHFSLGFADLKGALGGTMGDPVECEHPNSANGDTLQQTSTGLAMYRQSTNTSEFTDGWNHWALEPAGIVAWSGGTEFGPVAAPGPVPWGDVPSLQSPPVVAQQPRPSNPAPVAGTQCVDLGGGTCLSSASELADTIVLLSHSSSAMPLLKTAAKLNYLVHYGDLPMDVLGLFRPAQHEVVMSNVLKTYPTLDRAPVLAHELTHVSDWNANPALLQTSAGCLSTEVHAFHTESTTWQELGDSHQKPANDLEREFNMISQAIATDPTGFIDRLAVVYHSQCAPA